MKKFKVLALVLALAISVLMFTGCAGQILYGTWQLEETIHAETGESEEPMFSGMMVFTINRDGTVIFLDEIFGTYEKTKNEYVFTYTTDEDEEPAYETGAWELLGTDLYLYDDSGPYIYHFVAVEVDDEEDTEE